MPLSDADAARALDAWLKEHLGSAGRREAVRAVADRLEDLTGCEYDDLDEALELSTWPNLTRKRFVAAWRRLKAEAAPMWAGQWSARKAQMLAKAYKKAGGGYTS